MSVASNKKKIVAILTVACIEAIAHLPYFATDHQRVRTLQKLSKMAIKQAVTKVTKEWK